MLCCVLSCSVMSDSLQPHGLYVACQAPLSLGKNTGVGCNALLERIFLIQGSNLGLLHCRWILYCLSHQGSSEEPACQCRKGKRCGFDLWVWKSPGGGNGSPLQYSCLANPQDRGAWRTTVHGAAKSRTGLKRLSTHAGLGALGEDCSDHLYHWNHLF